MSTKIIKRILEVTIKQQEAIVRLPPVVLVWILILVGLLTIAVDVIFGFLHGFVGFVDFLLGS